MYACNRSPECCHPALGWVPQLPDRIFLRVSEFPLCRINHASLGNSQFLPVYQEFNSSVGFYKLINTTPDQFTHLGQTYRLRGKAEMETQEHAHSEIQSVIPVRLLPEGDKGTRIKLVKPSFFIGDHFLELSDDSVWGLIDYPKGNFEDSNNRRYKVELKPIRGKIRKPIDLEAFLTGMMVLDMFAILLDENPNGYPNQLWKLLVKDVGERMSKDLKKRTFRFLKDRKLYLHVEDPMAWRRRPEAYPYEALMPQMIRLIDLAPSRAKENEVACSLYQRPLEQNLTYEALSYVWGDTTKTRQIIVNGRPFQATENLEKALRQLRYADKPRILWVDAICINQRDVAERNEQVKRMTCIYQNAERVIAWLGSETNTTSAAMEFVCLFTRVMSDSASGQRISSSLLLEQMAATLEGRSFGRISILTEDVRECKWNTTESDAIRRRFRSNSAAFFENPKFNLGWLALTNLLKRTWWKRVWVFQEVVSARDILVQCGSHSIPWGYFTAAISSFRLHAKVMETTREPSQISRQRVFHDFMSTGGYWALVTMGSYRTLRRGNVRLQLEDLLASTAYLEATDPRDKLYALFGLLDEKNVHIKELLIDYGSPMEKVFVKATKVFLESTQTLQYFRFLGPVARNPYLPSWVPDLSTTTSRPLPLYSSANSYLHYVKEPLFRASLEPKSRIPFKFSPNLAEVTLRGVGVDSITSVSDYCEESNHFDIVFNEWRDMLKVDDTTPYVRGGCTLEAYWRTLLGDSWIKIENTSPKRIGAEFDGIANMLPMSLSVEKKFEKVMHAIPRDLTFCNRRVLFKTSQGLFGLGPRGVCSSDIVTVLLGGSVPIILHPCGNEFAMVGERYVLHTNN